MLSKKANHEASIDVNLGKAINHLEAQPKRSSIFFEKQAKITTMPLRRTCSSPNLHKNFTAKGPNILALPGAASKFEQGVSNETEIVRVYRVEGRINERIFIDESGNIDVPRVDTSPGFDNKFIQERMLYLNFGNEERAYRFYKQRLKQYPEDSSFSIKSFDVLKSVMNEIQASAVPMHKRNLDKDQPVIADPTKNSKEGLDQFGLPPKQIEKLREAIIPYSGKKITKLSP